MQRQQSINDAMDAVENYQDENYETFWNYLFHDLLFHIKEIPFDNLITEVSSGGPIIYKTWTCHQIKWFYTIQRQEISNRTVYSFRFPDFNDLTAYDSFHVERHRRFRPVEWRHQSRHWYEYVGSELKNEVDDYLNINKVIQSGQNHRTTLFVNPIDRRIDIEICFGTSEKISITFEPALPQLD